MIFARVLRWACDARQLATLREINAGGREWCKARREADRLYDVLLGDGPNGPLSWNVTRLLIPAYNRQVIPILRRADAGRRRLGSALWQCRILGIPRWQVRLALF